MLNLSGQTFGRLTAIAPSKPMGRRSAWLCVCSCGNTKDVRTEHLRGRRVMSCGCLRNDKTEALKLSHGEARAGRWTVEFRAWCAAKSRCYSANNGKYPTYGARGIKMCDEWLNDFSAFLAHVGRKPHPSMSLDRKDVNGDYEPGNVRWATAREQRMNQRRMQSG